MRAVRIERTGGPEVLQLIELPTPTPAPGQVRVRTSVIGVNFADVLCRRGTHRSMPQPPIVPGCEVAGVIDACGDGIDTRRLGERVGVYSPWGGGYADALVVPAAYALPLPSSIADDAAAAFTHLALTADAALGRVGRARAGETLLVTAAAGGLGSMLLQLGAALGLDLFAATGSTEKSASLRSRGVTRIFDYGHPGWGDEIVEATGGRGIDLIVETVGGSVFEASQRLLAPLGRIVVAGAASGDAPIPGIEPLIDRSASCATLNLSVLYANQTVAMRNRWDTLLALHATGRLQPVIGHRFPLARADAAHRLLESRGSRDKIVLDVA